MAHAYTIQKGRPATPAIARRWQIVARPAWAATGSIGSAWRCSRTALHARARANAEDVATQRPSVVRAQCPTARKPCNSRRTRIKYEALFDMRRVLHRARRPGVSYGYADPEERRIRGASRSPTGASARPGAGLARVCRRAREGARRGLVDRSGSLSPSGLTLRRSGAAARVTLADSGSRGVGAYWRARCREVPSPSAAARAQGSSLALRQPSWT